MAHKLIFILGVLCVSVQGEQLSVVISPADGYVAWEGSDETEFHCTAMAITIVWFVDDVSLADTNTSIITRVQPDVLTQDGSRRRSTIRILNTEMNNNISLRCLAFALSGNSGFSTTVYFLVQGLLNPLNSLEITAKDNFTRRLTWQAPQTLNITDVEPDIDHYIVCVNFTLTGEQSCSDIPGTDLEYLFTNVRVPLQLSVSAVNVVGEGGSETVFHEPCDSTSAQTVVNGDLVSTEVTFQANGSNLEVRLSFVKVMVGSEDLHCFDVYRIKATSLTQNVTLGPFIPFVTDVTNAQELTLTVRLESGLIKNQVYSVNIISVGIDGQNSSIGTIQFSTYDIQAVSVSPRPGALEVDCTFTPGSQTSICQVTVCEVVQGAVVNDSCQNVRVPRSPSASAQILDNLQLGLYTIQTVLAEDSVGVQTQFTSEYVIVLNLTDVQITELAVITTTSDNSMPSTGPNSSLSIPEENTVLIAGCVVGVAVVITISFILIVILLLYLRSGPERKRKAKAKYTYGVTSTELWLEGNQDLDGNGATQLKVPPTDNFIAPNFMTSEAYSSTNAELPPIIQGGIKRGEFQLDSGELKEPVDSQVGPIPPHSHSPTYDLLGQSEFNEKRHSTPTTAVYPTTVDALSERDDFNLHNLSPADIHEVKLTASLDNLIHGDGSYQNTSDLKPSKSHDALLPSGSTNKSLYAEIQLHPKSTNKPTNTSPNTLVLYSELQIDELHPIVPEKKRNAGKTWSQNSAGHSAQARLSLMSSLGTSDPTLESYKV